MQIRNKTRPTEQKGYFTLVQDNPEYTDVSYIDMAYVAAMSCKLTQKENNFSIGVDKYTKSLLTDKHFNLFDHVIDIPGHDAAAGKSWKLHNEWKSWSMTPYY